MTAIMSFRIQEEDKTDKLKELEIEYRKEKERIVRTTKRQQAIDVIRQYEGQYDRAKRVFFAVNGARRILNTSNDRRDKEVDGPLAQVSNSDAV